MNVAFLFLHPFSESPGSSIRVDKLARSLGSLGVDCTIFTPYENYQEISNNVRINPISALASHGHISSSAYKLSKRIYYSKLLKWNLSMYIKANQIMAKRLAFSIHQKLVKGHMDLLQVEQDITIAAGLELKKLTGIPVVADIHNLAPLELASAGLIETGGESFQLLSKWIRLLLSQVDLIVAVSEEMKAYIVSEYNLPKSKIIVVPPGGTIRPLSSRKNKLPIKVAYAGLVAYREHIDLYIRSIPYAKARMPDVQFYISKKGDDFKKLMMLSTRLGVDISPFWYENINDFHSFLDSCSVAILPSKSDDARKIGTPLKLFEYISFGLPVVANDIGAWSDIIKKEKLGIVTEDDPAEFGEGIIELLRNPEYAKECGQRGVELVKQRYNWNNSSKILLDGYNIVLNKSTLPNIGD